MMKDFLRNLFLLPVYFYQRCFSPMLGRSKCRYTPSCSDFFIQSVKRFGVFKGGLMGFARLFRCSRWFWGGADEVPKEWSWKQIKDCYTIFRKR